ncbi:MAG: hypothetical protein VX938_08440, partial [Myxococcota bacterium]|nr:hypothetical protein [Myxococcota bacterium]
MSGFLGLFQFFVLSVAMLAGVVALATAVVYPQLRPRLKTMGPARRARLLTVLCMAPLVLALIQTGLLFAPGVLGAVWPELDHC